MGPRSCTAATASSRRVQRAITRPDRSSRGLFMRVRRRSGQLYCRQRHHCVATNPPQHRTIACTRDTYRSLQTFSTLLGSRNLLVTMHTARGSGRSPPYSLQREGATNKSQHALPCPRSPTVDGAHPFPRRPNHLVEIYYHHAPAFRCVSLRLFGIGISLVYCRIHLHTVGIPTRSSTLASCFCVAKAAAAPAASCSVW